MPTMIESLIGAVDIHGDPIPPWNREGVILGLTVSFSVRSDRSPSNEPLF